VNVLRESLDRLGGAKLAAMTDVAGGAVRGVFYGIVGTAAIQGALMWAGMLIAGVPGAAPLGFVTLILAISQFGGILINLVWGGAAWWIYTNSGTGAAFWFIVVWGLFVTFIDNLLKPLLIGSSMRLPIMLVILGVFGGFISFGFLGLFIGPTLLAVAYELLAAWREPRITATAAE
jgi:predicted PurR-regulated permease PerM